MENLFKKYNIFVNKNQIEAFKKYYDILIEYNKMFNLTAITEEKEVYIKHFIDSIIKNQDIKGKTLVDIGSGGGFPAIPIKVMRENLSVTMIEATNKKCDFLKKAIEYIGLKDIVVINGRAEELCLTDKYREKFDTCTARAVARLNTLSEYCLPFVKVGGEFIAFKGNVTEELNEAENAIQVLGGKIENIYEYELEQAKRTIVYIKKITKTDKKYPRGHGKERKNPL